MVCATVVVGTSPGLSLPRLRRALEERDLAVTLLDGEGSAEAASTASADVAILSVPSLTPGELRSLIARVHEQRPEASVVLLGVEDTARAAVEAMRAGACEYTAETDLERVATRIEEAARRALPLAHEAVRDDVDRHDPAPAVLAPANDPSAMIIGRSAEAERLRDLVQRVARSAATTVLIQGESGTGKDLVARSIHAESARRAAPFVPINCSAIPETLLESELFGHEAGAFTDAKSRKRGLLEIAHRGTVYLDEVAEMGIGLQAKFLRFLEERSLRHLGGTKSIDIDVLVIAGTNVDITSAVESGAFRTDLYYRLKVVPIWVAPLRDRRDDIPILAAHFLTLHARRLHKRFDGFHPEAKRKLAAHSWPGNIRELRNAIERVVLLEEGPVVHPEMLLLGERSRAATAPPAATARATKSTDPELRLDRIEVEALVRALEMSEGNQSSAARLLGVSRDAVRHRIEKYGIVLETRARVTRPPAGPLVKN
jgi:two-component system response regulator AtoC